MGETYRQLRERHQKEINQFPIVFAFSKQQLSDGVKKAFDLDLNTSASELRSIGCGGFILKKDADALHEMLSRHGKELKEGQQDYNFCYEMFVYEMNDHEFSYTGDLEEVLNACSVTNEELEKSVTLQKALAAARKKCN